MLLSRNLVVVVIGVAALLVAVCGPVAASPADDSSALALIHEGRVAKDGQGPLLEALGATWQAREDGTLAGRGEGNDLVSRQGIGAGDFVVRSRLRVRDRTDSAAAISFGEGYFGFEGRRDQEVFVSGALFGGYRNLGKAAHLLPEEEDWIDFEARRAGAVITVSIGGRELFRHAIGEGEVGRLRLIPFRGRFEVAELSGEANWIDVGSSLPPGYSIPTIDLAGETERQVVVDRQPGQYLGHPTTVLLEDGKTILAVYPKGHGRGAIVLKRSEDGGRTWSDRLQVPDNWETSLETPTIHRVIDAEGKKRLILFSGLYPVRMAVSNDDGREWSPLLPIGEFGGIVAMSSVERLANGDYMALFHDDGRFIDDSGKRGAFLVYKTISSDGGLTWSRPEVIARHPRAHLCEPGLVRSPDGKRIAVLLRENSRRYNSFVIFSDDEGREWTEPRELPGALTGDRHVGKYAPDGRLVISFRDTTRESPTHGDWVAWVGRFEDIIEGREGQYRVRLMDNHRGADCAYPALELLPDGTFVATTYGHWTPGESPYIVSVRFRLQEIDRKASGSSER